MFYDYNHPLPQQIIARKELGFLKDWSGQTGRKPLLLRGARQTGKTTLVREFARMMSFDRVEVNFERNPEYIEVFSIRDPQQILTNLMLMTDRTINPDSSILFLDEIQAAPEALVSLRYFYEEKPELRVLAAGSLLEFSLTNAQFSMPVGRLEYLHLGPMQFEDFLRATGHDSLASWFRDLSLEKLRLEGISPALHKKCLELLKQYWIVGGLPEAMAKYAESGDFRAVSRVHQGIIETYRDDFNKYSHGNLKQRIQLVFEQLPRLVGRRLKYAQISRDHRSAELADALQQLCLARIAHKIIHSSANGIPLGAEINERRFKMLYMDIGLLCSALKLNVLDLDKQDLTLVNSGAVAEQFVGQHLLYSGRYYETPALHYWAREARNAAAEVDYLLASGRHIVPVEVKSGSSGKLKSLHQFIGEKQVDLGLRLNAELPVMPMDHTTKRTDGSLIQYKLLSLPMYLVCQTRRLLESCLTGETSD